MVTRTVRCATWLRARAEGWGRIYPPWADPARAKPSPSRRLAWGLTEATKEFPQEYERVTAVTADGKQIKGVTLNEDSFSVQIMDSGEQIHLLDKETLKSFQKTRESAMPKYNADILSDKDLEDIVAFLVGVGAK